MDILTSTIAQEIVNRTMKILSRNINVMDEYGVIIGSGDRSRIGQIHEGALNVIKKRARIDIKEEESKFLTGVKPGINLPIVFENQIVGVIGISGTPTDISYYGELVKMGAEMTLQQAFLAEQLQWDVRLREELVNQLIHNEIDELAMERATRFGIDLSIPRIAILIEVVPTSLDDETITRVKKQLMSHLIDRLQKEDLIASTTSSNFVVLKKVNKQTNEDKVRIVQEVKEMMKWFSQSKSIMYKVGIGVKYNSIEGANNSYEMAKQGLRVGKILFPEMNIYNYNDIVLPVLLSHIASNETTLTRYYELVVQNDKKGELQETLLHFIEENGELNQVAAKLYIHRNTLRYRLSKIHELTGKDPRKIKDLLELYISKYLYQLGSFLKEDDTN